MRTLRKSVAFILVFALMTVVTILPASAASRDSVINDIYVEACETDGNWATLFFDIDFVSGVEEYATHGYGRVYGPGVEYGDIFIGATPLDDSYMSFSSGELVLGEWYTLEIQVFQYATYLGAGYAYFEYTGESYGARVLGYDYNYDYYNPEITVYLNVNDFGGENFTQGYAWFEGEAFSSLNDQGYIELSFSYALEVGEKYTIELQAFQHAVLLETRYVTFTFWG